MKKLSISIFAMLAIVFAVGSAFTSAKVLGPTIPGTYFNDQNLSEPVTINDLGEEVPSDFLTNYSAYCDSDPSKTCAIKVKWNEPQTQLVVDVIYDGEFLQ